MPSAPAPIPKPDNVLREEDAYEVLGFSFPTWKKWAILTSVFICQLAMNWNAATYSTAVPGLIAQFGIEEYQAAIGQMIFLIAYAFGCEIWAPWSEELGRFWVMQISLLLVNIWQIPCALAPNFGTVMAFRALGGLSSAGGSVTLGIVADLFEPDNQQYAVAFVVLSSCVGSVLAPIAGGFTKTYLDWSWVFWITLIFGFVAQVIHAFVPETRSSVLLDRHAKKLRKADPTVDIWGPDESRGSLWQRLTFKHVCVTMFRPYQMLIFEPVVTFLSLLSGFSDALIFTGLDSYGIVMSKWNFSDIAVGLCFLSLLLGNILGYLSFLPVYKRDEKTRAAGKHYPAERRLWWLLYLVPLEPIGLFLYGWASLGPPHMHWIVPNIASTMIGIANFAIYLATVDYMIAAYGAYSSSATGGNGFCRDLLAGLAAMYARPMFRNIDPGTKWTLPIPSFILCGIGILLCIPVYVFYHYGERILKKSQFAMQQIAASEERLGRHIAPIEMEPQDAGKQADSAVDTV